MAWPFNSQTVTIANGQSLSGAISLGGGLLAAVAMPSGWTAAALSFQASDDGDTYRDVHNDDGAEYTVITAASRHVAIDPSKFSGAQWIKVRSGTAGTPVNQGGVWKLQKTNGSGSYGSISGGSSASTPTPTAGDTVEVVLEGAQITCKVNGAVIYTTSDTYLQGATVGGPMCIAAPNFRVDSVGFLPSYRS